MKLALGLVDLFGDDAMDEDAEARLKSAYVDVLKYAPAMARFEDRAMVFQELVHRDRGVRSMIVAMLRSSAMLHRELACLRWVQENVSQQSASNMGLVATIRRDHVLEDSLQLLCDLPSMDLKNRLRISFIDALGQQEAGIDGGGLFKDFIENLLQVRLRPCV